VLGLKGSYHGDTIGAMDACEGGIHNSTVEWYRGRGYWLDSPTLGWEDGTLRVRVPWNDKVFDLPSLGAAYDVYTRRGTSLEGMYRDYIISEITKALEAGNRFGALVMEPLVLGAGGMQFIDPLFQTILVEAVRGMSSHLLPPSPTIPSGVQSLPIIYDEVFTGLGRLGFSSPSQILGIKPDIAVYAKLLTGGLVPLAVTLTSEQIFEYFVGEEKRQALLHGHSYTAYPVGCEVANAALREIENALKGEEWSKARLSWANGAKIDTVIDPPAVENEIPGSLWSFNFTQALSRAPGIKRVMTLGTVLAFELDNTSQGKFLMFLASISVDNLDRLRILHRRARISLTQTP
jgi:bifunctional dethiobiotin synthetase / adenosylmethionine---8-amino-7-oxononanoate aminotransferase